MSSQYPGSVDPVHTVNPLDTLAAANHTQLHMDAMDRVEAIQTYLGVPVSGEGTGTVRERLVALEKASTSLYIMNSRATGVGTLSTTGSGWVPATDSKLTLASAPTVATSTIKFSASNFPRTARVIRVTTSAYLESTGKPTAVGWKLDDDTTGATVISAGYDRAVMFSGTGIISASRSSIWSLSTAGPYTLTMQLKNENSGSVSVGHIEMSVEFI